MERQVAKAIISSLTGGTVPIRHTQHYDVGRGDQVDTVKEEIETSASRLRFVNGDYGTGKTHFLATIRYWAMRNGFVPSHVVLSPRGAPLNDLRAVYSSIVRNLGILDEDAEHSPLEGVLEFIYQAFQSWLKKAIRRKRRRCPKYIMDPLFCYHCNVSGNIEELYIKGFRKLNVNLQTAIVVYRYARWGHNPDFKTADMVIRWLEGEPLYRRELNHLGVWGNVEQDDILRGLGEIAKLVSLVGKKRMIIMLDEAEGIESLTPYQRPIAYDNLQFLIKGVMGIDNLYFLYATTPTFFNDVESYSRKLTNIVSGAACTDLVPLTGSEYTVLGSKICDIYLASLDTSNVEILEPVLRKVTSDYCERYIPRRPTAVRDFITNLISEIQQAT